MTEPVAEARNRPGDGRRWAVGCVLAVVVFGAGIAWFLSLGGGLPDEAGLAALREQARPMTERLMEYRARWGHFPVTLGQAGIEPPGNEYGTWEYHRDSEQECLLSIGDYAWDGFVYYWHATGEHAGWISDT